MTTLPCFVSHYSISRSILTLEPKGKTKPGAPASIVDMCCDAGLTDCMLIDTTLGGVYEASRNLGAAGVNLFFGYKVIVCADMNDKTDKSRGTESKVIICPRNMAKLETNPGWTQLVKIANRAATDGFYYKPRTSWAQLKELWTDDLVLVLPFFSSFISRNTLTLNHVIPDLSAAPTLMYEVNSGLPFAPLITKALDAFNKDGAYPVQRTKTIYYPTRASMESYITYRAKLNRATFAKPNIDHLASDEFSLQSYLDLTKPLS